MRQTYLCALTFQILDDPLEDIRAFLRGIVTATIPYSSSGYLISQDIFHKIEYTSEILIRIAYHFNNTHKSSTVLSNNTFISLSHAIDGILSKDLRVWSLHNKAGSLIDSFRTLHISSMYFPIGIFLLTAYSFHKAYCSSVIFIVWFFDLLIYVPPRGII